ncbi:pre-mRNA-processing factor 17 [Chloropicon primus]|uniref:Pre-mRNA-processing factor 17 n=1 Tax=Chloropicon primus TaxID=1764295 RepID=A0A5B8MFA3_9CHLO|nr:pre-mRNA-processing factor 17 [Chloropicon primus]UPQ98296.1 pre-mRNA-processing factor 17 [Chloropicon primus]|eukprot:QDZ19087.1 pre-mRNA-processing factor 17 [Chloropicon primus]
MEFLAQYGDEEDEGGREEVGPKVVSSAKIVAAPEVDTVGLALAEDKVVRQGQQLQYQDPSKRVVYQNFKYEEMCAPLAGPSRAFESSGLNVGAKNHPLGNVQVAHVSSYNFDKQFTDFHSQGGAVDPAENRLVSSRRSAPEKPRPAKMAKAASGVPTSRPEKEEEEEEEEEDPFEWRGSKTPWKERTVEAAEYTEEQKKILEEQEKKNAVEAETKTEPEKREDKSFFHGKSERDYAGRSWVEPPKHLRKENDHCYVPKRCIHTWNGHSQCVQAIRFFPESGHLLLSAGMDSKIKIWDVNDTGKCMRTYLGHQKAVRDICFSNDGRKFLSTGYDRNIKLWDTETGQVIRTLSSANMLGYCVKFHPDDDKQNTVLAGCSNKKIYQFDTDSGDIVQEYNEHLGAVNSITFVDENRRFVSTSDDKTMRVWDFGIPVQIKYIADPTMHSMPSVALHPNGNFLVAQSLDNKVVICSTKERFKMNRKRVFKGHNSAGYACQVNFSPDGRFVISGDAEGRCFFWDWKTSRVFRKMKCHDGVCMGAEWHPLETSKVATCGWDGKIRYWD